MTKYHELDDLETTESYFLTVLEAGRLGSGCQHVRFRQEPLPGLQCAHVALRGCVCAQRTQAAGISSDRGTNPIGLRPCSCALICFPNAPSPNAIAWKVRASTYEFGAGTQFGP